MKKVFLTLVMAFSFTVVIAQSKIEKDIIGNWQIYTIQIEDWSEINYEKGAVTWDKAVLKIIKDDKTGDIKKAYDEMKRKEEENLKFSYYEFAGNNKFSCFMNGKFISGTFSISEGSEEGRYDLELDHDKGEEEYVISIQQSSNGKKLIFHSDLEEASEGLSDALVDITYRNIADLDDAGYKNRPEYKQFEKGKSALFGERAKEEKAEKENQARKDREDREIEERLRKELRTTNKVNRSNLSIAEALDIVYGKFEEGRIQDLNRNEKISLDYTTDKHLYKSTLSVKKSEVCYISDYESKKTFHIYFGEAGGADDLGRTFYNYLEEIEAWTKRKGGFKRSRDTFGRSVEFKSNDLRIELNLFLSGNVDMYILQMTVSQ